MGGADNLSDPSKFKEESFDHSLFFEFENIDLLVGGYFLEFMILSGPEDGFPAYFIAPSDLWKVKKRKEEFTH